VSEWARWCQWVECVDIVGVSFTRDLAVSQGVCEASNAVESFYVSHASSDASERFVDFHRELHGGCGRDGGSSSSCSAIWCYLTIASNVCASSHHVTCAVTRAATLVTAEGPSICDCVQTTIEVDLPKVSYPC